MGQTTPTTKLTVVKRDGSMDILDLHHPLKIDACPDPNLKLWTITDATGTDYFFNKDDGSYDGWGKPVSSNAEAEAVLQQAGHTLAAPKLPVQ